ncbi:hypothetical protein EX30DRAFT_242371 [Ascodesmis nigricans]|uniref:Uncharacterized protein n=1 Tax=Ascodesmis nigricans TaxID=341454 RepID=A0A4S2MI80_9PEZI|nr:hypothetical protein EX30DRAFT_242371 [Ascodesmis nigricans]
MHLTVYVSLYTSLFDTSRYQHLAGSIYLSSHEQHHVNRSSTPGRQELRKRRQRVGCPSRRLTLHHDTVVGGSLSPVSRCVYLGNPAFCGWGLVEGVSIWCLGILGVYALAVDSSLHHRSIVVLKSILAQTCAVRTLSSRCLWSGCLPCGRLCPRVRLDIILLLFIGLARLSICACQYVILEPESLGSASHSTRLSGIGGYVRAGSSPCHQLLLPRCLLSVNLRILLQSRWNIMHLSWRCVQLVHTTPRDRS